MQAGWVYIMSNRPNGTLYVGVTNDLARRVAEHKEGTGSGFARKYGIDRLVWCEAHNDILTAIQRETSIKRWPRAWKVRLIVGGNPEWDDLPVHWWPPAAQSRGWPAQGRP
jgi:putative endonuclease